MTQDDTLVRHARVLVVEDGITMRMFYRDVLERAGFVVDEAANGLEGVERALRQPFDLLIVDINMPRMDGYQVARALRADETTGQVPMVAISTEDRPGDVLRAYDAGANYYLAKPVDSVGLVAMTRLMTGTPPS